MNIQEIEKESIFQLEKKYGKGCILKYDSIEYKNNMKSRNPNIPDLLLSNYISVKLNDGTKKFTIMIGRGNTEEEVVNDYINKIKDF